MGKPKQFVHLHSHTEFSKLDGLSKVDDLVSKAVEDGSPAVTCTDHGNMAGSIQLVNKCREYDIKPIIGIEAYLARSMSSKDRNLGGEKGIFHQLLLARNLEGYRNMVKLTSSAYRDGFYNKPRIDLDILSRHSAGLIGTTTCLGSIVNQELLKGNRKEALRIASDFRDVFEPGSYFVEVQNHGIKDQLAILNDQVWLSEQLGVPLVATNDNHYTDSCDADVHDTLLCINSGSRKSDVDRFKFDSDQHYIKTAAEMYDLFPERDFPGACSSTLDIAEMVELDLDTSGQNHLLPEFPLPEGWGSAAEYLRHLVMKGARDIYSSPAPDAVMDRIDHELNIIEKMGFSDYFLILSDVVRYMRAQGCLIGPGRGSAAGAIVAYCLGITSVDPLEHGLYFERFLNEGRKSMPDIDVDFDPEYRDMAFDYVADKYGHDSVAFIGTYGTLKGRGAIKDSVRVMGGGAGLGSDLASKYPVMSNLHLETMLDKGADKKLDDPGMKKSWREGQALRDAYSRGDDLVKDALDQACQIMGTIRNEGVHPAGIVITPGKAQDYIPLRTSNKSDTIMTSQYSMGDVESVGALKYDFLGLSNLTTIKRAVEMIDRDMGKVVDVMSLPLDDESVYRLLRSGDLDGIFQVTSPGMMDLINRMQPTEFEDISAAIALYRPGPMASNVHLDYADRKNGRQKVTGVHPDFLKITKSTQGLVVFQEQIMQLAQHFAGYSGVEADNFRKAMGKKNWDVMEEQHQKFLDGVQRQGFPKKVGKTLWDIIEPFAGYAFNKSHSVAYGKITYITAWIKANYPAQFYAAAIDCMGSDKAPGFVSAAKSHGINVYAPDINKSGWGCTTSRDSIWLGMGGISHCGRALIDGIERERTINGKFDSIGDFLVRVAKSTKINKTSATNLVHASLFDSLHSSRKAIVDNIEAMLIDAKNIASHTSDDSEEGLFDLDDDVPTSLDSYDLDQPDYPDQERSALELESIGFFVSGHPFDDLARHIPAAKLNGLIPDDAVTPDTPERVYAGAQGVNVYGILTSVTVSRTKSKKEMTKFVVESGYGSSMECVLFGRTLDKSSVGSFAVVKGNVKLSYEAINRDRDEGDEPESDSLADLEMTCNDISIIKADRITRSRPVKSVESTDDRKPKRSESARADSDNVVDLREVKADRGRKAASRRSSIPAPEPEREPDEVEFITKVIIEVDSLKEADSIKSILQSMGSGESVITLSYRGVEVPFLHHEGGGFLVTDDDLSELDSLSDVGYRVVH